MTRFSNNYPVRIYFLLYIRTIATPLSARVTSLESREKGGRNRESSLLSRPFAGARVRAWWNAGIVWKKKQKWSKQFQIVPKLTWVILRFCSTLLAHSSTRMQKKKTGAGETSQSAHAGTGSRVRARSTGRGSGIVFEWERGRENARTTGERKRRVLSKFFLIKMKF